MDHRVACLLEEFARSHGVPPSAEILQGLRNARLDGPRLLPAPPAMDADDPLRRAFDVLYIRAACLNTRGTLLPEEAFTRLCDGLYLHADEAFFTTAEHHRVGHAPARRIDRLASELAPLHESLQRAYESVARIAAAPAPLPWRDVLILERGFPTFDASLPALRAAVALRFNCAEDAIRHEPLGLLHILLVGGTRALAFIGEARRPPYEYMARTRTCAGISANGLARFMRSTARAHTQAPGLWHFIDDAMDIRSRIQQHGPITARYIARLEPYADRWHAARDAAAEIQAALRDLTAFLLDDVHTTAHSGTDFTTARYVVSYRFDPHRVLRCTITASDTPAADVERDEERLSRSQTPEVVE